VTNQSKGRRSGLLAILAAASVSWLPGVACSPDALNVLLLTVDTLRPDHMGIYGYERDTTPNLDRFFAAGTVFENAISSSPCTIPSVRQILAGGHDLRAERSPLAEILREGGWSTGAVVSQHQFDYETDRDYARGFDHFDLQGPGEVDHHDMTTRTADQVSDRGLAWLERHRRERPGRPFFLWLHYFDPHDPYEPPDSYREFDRGNRSQRSGDRRRYLMEEKRPDDQWPTAGYVFSEADVAHLVNLYDGEIRFTDAQIGRVLDALARWGLTDRTVVAFTSDHGEWLGERDMWDHCLTLQEPEIRVPLLFRVASGRLTASAHGDGPVSTLDLLPTLLGSLGVPLPEGGDYHGQDLRRASSGRVLLSFWHGVAAVRDADWKLHWAGRSIGLFRLSEARIETKNVLLSHPRVRKRLEDHLADSRALRRRVSAEAEETVRQLRSIGYVE